LAIGISRALRLFVAERAAHRCEYCLLHEDDSHTPHQVDHIISIKHGGSSEPQNLAYVCLRCNLWKGTDVAAIDERTGRLVRIFDPRRQDWRDHFAHRGTAIEALTEEGAATIRLLKLNFDKRLDERRLLIAAGRYPR
jgi:hypothetical protein